MNILAIDTSSKYFYLAIAEDDKIKVNICPPSGRELSRMIIPLIERALKKARLSLKDIDCFACGLGPGSFTGLRVGLAVIKGFAFSLNKPVVGIISLDCLAGSQSDFPGYVCPIVDARRSLVYSAIYRAKNGILKREGRYLLVPLKELFAKLKGRANIIFLGDGLSLYRDDIKKEFGLRAHFADEGFWYPRPENLLKLAREKIRNREIADLDKLVPFYMYPKECQIKEKVKSEKGEVRG
ncbi:MAG: tRNA (adenosine(37)-N6)-threonylcarbamoyltransferase complex dimerization subunit type 1 TsaB [Candidatus Omnitrophota bacterium]|nr:tRNA (adenosine(37)-N6)-threonylcarbamoyltransferase complex dimerization subunit type 1 TsaB [Candidatus Omnitrophota bacterium]